MKATLSKAFILTLFIVLMSCWRLTSLQGAAATAIAISYAGTYDTSSTYSQGNIVVFGNASYMALGSVSTNSSPGTSPSLWTIFAALPSQQTSFGTGSNSFTLDFVTIGSPGNTIDTTGYGKVSYTYQIGAYDISQNQINIAASNGLLGISGVASNTWTGDLPATGLTWYQAAAFVNWLNTSQGYSPAYNLTYSNNSYSLALWPTNEAWTLGGVNLYRNAECCYFLPSENEWYKAAYYDPNKSGIGHPGYWLYPTGNSSAPTAVASGTAARTAVYNQINTNASPSSVFLAGGSSSYGTTGQGGNVFQWGESAFSGKNTNVSNARVIRGGDYALAASYLRSSDRASLAPSAAVGIVGFRVASIIP